MGEDERSDDATLEKQVHNLSQKSQGVVADMLEVDDVVNTLHSGPNLEDEGVENGPKTKDEELHSISDQVVKTVDSVKLQLAKMKSKKVQLAQEAKDKKDGKTKERSQKDKDEMSAFLAAGPSE